MPHDIDHNTAAQRRTSKLLAAMAIFICLGIVAYIILTLLVNRQTPANPDTHYTGTNGSFGVLRQQHLEASAR